MAQGRFHRSPPVPRVIDQRRLLAPEKGELLQTTRPYPVLCGRKSGYAPVEMTILFWDVIPRCHEKYEMLAAIKLSSRPEPSWALRPIQGDEKRLGPATTIYATVVVPFVIPSVPGFPTSPALTGNYLCGSP
jgi:hypothetical protein